MNGQPATFHAPVADFAIITAFIGLYYGANGL